MDILLSFTQTRFLGLDWSLWSAIGLSGNALFGSRFFLQWVVSERRRESIIPVSFWWVSIIGSVLLSIYFLGEREPVGILATLPNSLVYARNLALIRRKRLAASGSAPAT